MTGTMSHSLLLSTAILEAKSMLSWDTPFSRASAAERTDAVPGCRAAGAREEREREVAEGAAVVGPGFACLATSAPGAGAGTGAPSLVPGLAAGDVAAGVDLREGPG